MYSEPCFVLKNKEKFPVNWGYGQFSEVVFYNNYSRSDNGQEDYHDMVFRVIDGVFSIRKNYYIKNNIKWDEDHWQNYAHNMMRSMTAMHWLPPGRGIHSMGTRLMYLRGSACLYNCCFTKIETVEDLCFLQDMIGCGVGVGFEPILTNLELHTPLNKRVYYISDDREGWIDSIRTLLNAYFEGSYLPSFVYDAIRLKGSPLIMSGGIASGPKPLRIAHMQLEERCLQYLAGGTTEIQFKTDLANILGVCMVTGNMRRGAEIGLFPIDTMDLKDYKKYPERADWGWMSNNSIKLTKSEDFEQMGKIALANIRGHDVGYINMMNMRYGRIGKRDKIPRDKATGINPCGEIPLEDKEVCNVADSFPTRCKDYKDFLLACEYATFYCSTVTLLPTHRPETNAVVARNRRIGVGLVDYTGWTEELSTCEVTKWLRQGYKKIRKINKQLANEAGVPESIRVSTIKPGGTTTKIAGRTSGAGYPTHKYTLRRLSINKEKKQLIDILSNAGVPHEECAYQPEVILKFEFPIVQGPAESAINISLWQQAMNVVLLQREWADNSVSCTLYFKPKWTQVLKGSMNDNVIRDKIPGIVSGIYYENIAAQMWLIKQFEWTEPTLKDKYKLQINEEIDDYILYEFNPQNEEGDIESVLSAIAPLTKSISLLPHSAIGIYPQMPEEGISKEEYERRIREIKEIDWSLLSGHDGEGESYCTGDICEVPSKV